MSSHDVIAASDVSNLLDDRRRDVAGHHDVTVWERREAADGRSRLPSLPERRMQMKRSHNVSEEGPLPEGTSYSNFSFDFLHFHKHFPESVAL